MIKLGSMLFKVGNFFQRSKFYKCFFGLVKVYVKNDVSGGLSKLAPADQIILILTILKH